ncbi:MAG: hypothetical protein NC218_08155 [Acetobacter sp.]|nr:hypothetical protein [Acetobacter sp.]
MGRRKVTDNTVEAEKFIDEARLDTNQRAKDTVDYERMLMAFIENEFKGEN